MEIEKPSISAILGMILSVVGLFLFLGINLDPVLIPTGLNVTPLIGGVILGVGLALLFHGRNIITTIITALAFLALAIINWIAIGFAFGILIPGLTGKAKSLPIYLTAILLFVGTVMVVTNNPTTYQNMILDQITNITYENMGSLQSSMQTMMENQIEAMLPSRAQIEQMAESMLPCDNQTYQELCLSARQQLVEQMYQQIHSPEYREQLMSQLPKIEVTKDQIKTMIVEMPLIKMLMDNIQYVIALIKVGWFLVYSLAITIPQSILDFFLSLLPKKEKEESQ